MWQFKIERDALENLEWFKKTYPGYIYIPAMRGDSGTIVRKNAAVLKYGDPIPCDDGLFYPPMSFNPAEHLSKRKDVQRIGVTLADGTVLHIIPGVAEPRKFIFSLDGSINESADQYQTEYGQEAFKLYLRQEINKEAVAWSDPAITKVIMLSLLASYNIPLVLLNWWAPITCLSDFQKILYAAFGVDEPFLAQEEQL